MLPASYAALGDPDSVSQPQQRKDSAVATWLIRRASSERPCVAQAWNAVGSGADFFCRFSASSLTDVWTHVRPQLAAAADVSNHRPVKIGRFKR